MCQTIALVYVVPEINLGIVLFVNPIVQAVKFLPISLSLTCQSVWKDFLCGGQEKYTVLVISHQVENANF